MHLNVLNPFSDARLDQAAPDNLLDAAALARLRELDPDGSRGLLVRILRVFETSLVGAIEQLRGAQGETRARTVCELAHKMKSSSASVGASRLATLCAATESRLRPRSEGPEPVALGTAELDTVIAQLVAESEAALGMVRSMLEAGPAL